MTTTRRRRQVFDARKVNAEVDLLRHALSLARDWHVVLWKKVEANKMNRRDMKALNYLVQLARRKG